MLGKLLKYDFKDAKILMPIYGLSIGMSLISVILFKSGLMTGGTSIVQMLCGIQFMATIFSLIIVLAASMVIVVINFGKHTIGVGGQMMFTLPITIDQFLASKLISAVTIVICGILYLFAWMFGVVFILDCMPVIGIIFNQMSVLPIAIFLIISIITSILLYYSAIALSSIFSQNRVLGSVVAYLCISFAMQIIGAVVTVVAGLGLALNIEKAFLSNEMMMVNGAFITMAIYELILAVVFYLIVRHQFSKKINLP